MLNLDYGAMSEREKKAANSIAAATVGIHFSPAVGDYLINLIKAHTVPKEGQTSEHLTAHDLRFLKSLRILPQDYGGDS